MRIALLVLVVLGCTEQKEAPAPRKRQLPELPVVAPTATPPSKAAPVGWWRSDALCLELHDNGDFELAVTPAGRPKVLIVGTAFATRDGDRWKLQVTPTKIWQARFIGNCRKTVISAKELDRQDVLGTTLRPNESVSATIKIVDDATLCFGEQCATLRPETPTLRGRWERPRTAEVGKQQTWPKGEIVRLDLAGSSTTWALRSGTGDTGMDSIYGDADDTVTLVAPDQYELEIGKQRLTATRIAGQRLELCASSCVTLQRGFDSDRTDVPCRE